MLHQNNESPPLIGATLGTEYCIFRRYAACSAGGSVSLTGRPARRG
jgi:hypothetical protein